jgi:hypothetical protein
MAITIGIIALLVSIGLVALRQFKGRLTSFTLLEYQRAVLYRQGLPIREVGPGRYRVWAGSEKLIIVDTRAIQVSFENQAVALRDGSTAVYGISGTATVQDVRKAIYCARNYNQVPSFTVNELRGSKDGVAQEIINCAKPRLGAAGFELLAFRLSQISVTASQEGIN